MSEKNKCVFLSILTILKNATLIIPFIEGVISTIHKAVHPDSADKNIVMDESDSVPESELDRNLGYK